MPIITSQYKPPILSKKSFVSTVYSGLFRTVKGVAQQRERINLPDGDFLDLDWSFSKEKSNKLVIVLHGLEGNAQRPYMVGTARIFNSNGFDAVCVNFRGCSGEENMLYRSYHSGATEDLEAVVNHVLENKDYSELFIKGFSLGGNLLLKYLGERQDIPKQIKKTVAVSVPCDLKGSAAELHTLKNKLYAIRFKQHLVDRLKKKQILHPNKISVEEINTIKTLYDFDDVYTSKAHGFRDKFDYYEKCSCLQFLPDIKVPTLIINALNDSFLSPRCFPVKEAKQNTSLFLEMPNHGGHVGFIGRKGVYYNEKRALEFINQV